MKTEAFAKVNFTLEVLGRRVDGYHALRSVVVPVSLADTLDFELAEDGSITSDTGYADDLCVKAAQALRQRCPGATGVRLHVEKRIPAGGGLGGGSADAAAVLRTLNDLWSCGLSLRELADLGASVGSDVPALVLGQALRAPVLMEGRGETVAPLFDDATNRPPATLPLVLVNPGVFSSTPEVFRHAVLQPREDAAILVRMKAALLSRAPAALSAALQNDLEAPACALHPEIAAIKRIMLAEGARGAVMTGSGSTVLGLVASETEALRLAATLQAKGHAAWSATAFL